MKTISSLYKNILSVTLMFLMPILAFADDLPPEFGTEPDPDPAFPIGFEGINILLILVILVFLYRKKLLLPTKT